MKNVLIITYYWPPAGGPGVQRIVKLVKYLPEYGWRPTIFTVRDGEYPEIDHSLIKDIPESTEVIKTAALEPFAFYKQFTGKKTSQKLPAGYLGGSSGIKEKVARFIRMNLFIPDARVGWLPFARKKLHSLKDSHEFDLILSSSPPQTTQLVGMQAKKILKIPWITDFRDPWTDIYYYQKSERSALSKKMDRWLEKRVLLKSDCVISVSSEIIELLKSKLPRNLQTMVLPNGFDPEDFESIRQKPCEKFIISYIGKLSENQPVTNFIQAVKDAMSKNKIFRKYLEIVFIGSVAPVQRHELSEQLEGHVTFQGYIPHAEIAGEMSSASILFLIIPETPNNQGILTGKLFEYIGAEKPILAVGPEQGAVENVLSDLDEGAIFGYDKSNEMANWILEQFQQWEQNRYLKGESENKKKYSRKVHAGVLANKMNSLL